MFPYGGDFNNYAGLDGFNAFDDASDPDYQSMRYDILGPDSMEEEYGRFGTFDRFGRRHSGNSSPRLRNSRYGFETYHGRRGGYSEHEPRRGHIEFDEFPEFDMLEDRYDQRRGRGDYDSMRRRRNGNSRGYDGFGDYGDLWEDKAEVDFSPFDDAFGGSGSARQRDRRSRLLGRAQPRDYDDFTDRSQGLDLGGDYRAQSGASRHSRRRAVDREYFEDEEPEYLDRPRRTCNPRDRDLPSRRSLHPARYYGDDNIFEDYRGGGMHYDDLAEFFGPGYMNEHFGGIDGRVGGGPFGGF